MRILIENISIVPMTAPDEIIDLGYLIIENNKILEISEGKPPTIHFDKVIEGCNKVLLPGLINTHTHLAMTLFRGYADDLPLMEWLENKIWPLEDKLTAADVYWGTMLAIAEMIRSGTTSFADMYFFMEEVALAVQNSGVRGVLSRGLIGNGPNGEQSLQENVELIKKWNHQAEGRITVWFGPHAPYTCSPDYLSRVADLAKEMNVGIHIHLAETKHEYDSISEQFGKSPIALAEETGLFGCHVLAAHCVHLNARDFEILRKHNVKIAHNPESNMKLGSGIASVKEMLECGLTVSLGTDGASSNNNLDLLQEMRTAAFLQKVANLDPTALPAYQVLEMATINGARALGQEELIGSLAPGKQADMIIMDISKPHMVPCHDVVANIVYSAQAADVETVIVNGEVLMEARIIKSFDEDEVLRNAKLAAKRLTAGE